METVHYWIEVSFLLGVLGFMWKIGSDANSKIQTLFRRFDDHKVAVDMKMMNDFVKKEVFMIELAHTTKDLERVEAKMDAGFNNVDKKLDKLLNGVK